MNKLLTGKDLDQNETYIGKRLKLKEPATLSDFNIGDIVVCSGLDGVGHMVLLRDKEKGFTYVDDVWELLHNNQGNSRTSQEVK